MPKDGRRTRVPSLQHFCVLLGGSPADIQKRISRTGSIPVSYLQLKTLFLVDLIRLGVPPEHIEAACRKLKGQLNVLSNLDAFRVLVKFVQQQTPTNLMFVEKTYFPIGQNLRVPVNPPCVVTIGGKPSVLWPSLWKTDKFTDLGRAAFGTIMERSLFSLADFRGLDLTFLDCSARDEKGERTFRILRRGDFGELSDFELRQETDKFVEAYFEATGRGDGKSAPEKEADESEAPPLFLDDPAP